MDYEKAVKYIFEDEEWVKKVAIGALVTVLSIFILPFFILIGYGIQVARNVRDNDPAPLPEWDDWGRYLSEGFTVAVAQFIYALPILLIMGVGVATMAAGGAADADALFAVGSTIFVLLLCVAGLYGLVLMVISPVIVVQYLEHGTLGACLDIRTILDTVRNHMGDVVIVSVVVVAASAILSTVASLIPCLGIFLSLAVAPLTQMFGGHLYGQLATSIHGKSHKWDDIILPE